MLESPNKSQKQNESVQREEHEVRLQQELRGSPGLELSTGREDGHLLPSSGPRPPPVPSSTSSVVEFHLRPP